MKKRKLVKPYKRLFFLFLSLFLFLILLGWNFNNIHTSSIKNPSSGKYQEKRTNKDNIKKTSFDTTKTEESYVLYNVTNKKVLLNYNDEQKRAPASTTKLLTGIIALESFKEDDLVQVGSEVNVEGSRIGLNPGDVISVKELLTAMYVSSANDAAAALAVKTKGSIKNFAKSMNDHALNIGCKNTHFTNPHGLQDPDHYTTAFDLLLISRQFIKNKTLMNYVKLQSATINWKDKNGNTRTIKLNNTNKLLGIYPGDQGLKTGTTKEAGECLITYASNQDADLLLIMLGSKNRYNSTVDILDKGYAIIRAESALKRSSGNTDNLINSPGTFP